MWVDQEAIQAGYAILMRGCERGSLPAGQLRVPC